MLFSDLSLSEMYNILTYRNYWNFIKEDISLEDFKKKEDIQKVFLKGDSFSDLEMVKNPFLEQKYTSSIDKVSSLRENKGIEVIAKDIVRDKILVNRCSCQYCSSLYFSREYLNKIDWKVFEHLRDRYLSPLDLLRVLKAFNMETALLVKRILNMRLDMLDTSHSISTLEIENLNNRDEENEDYGAEY